MLSVAIIKLANTNHSAAWCWSNTVDKIIATPSNRMFKIITFILFIGDPYYKHLNLVE